MLNTTEMDLITETYVKYCPKRPCSDIPELFAYAVSVKETITPNNVKFLIWDFIGTKIPTDPPAQTRPPKMRF